MFESGKFILLGLAFSIVLLMGCQTQNDASAKFLDDYKLWRASLQRELDSGKSWVHGDPELLQTVGKMAPLFQKETLQLLEADPFLVIGLERSSLFADCCVSGSYPDGMAEQQRFWIDYLKKK